MKVGFIGAGKMAEAIAGALIGAKRVSAHQIFASDVSEERRAVLKRKHGVNVYSSNTVVVESAEVVFLAVKPQDLDDVLEEISDRVDDGHLVISIAAGKKMSQIESYLPRARVVRVMPNMACLVSEAMSVYCAGRWATERDGKTAADLLSCFGKVLELPEDQFDAVTAVSGSGPAFFAYFLQNMIKAGVKEGLSPEDSLLLAEQTMLGTSKLFMEMDIEPADLIKAVASAKGTTAAGLEVFSKSTLAKTVGRAVKAAAKRSRELSG